jgi:hypothetical protein
MRDIESGITGEPGRYRVDGGADCHGHGQRIEAGPELTGALEMASNSRSSATAVSGPGWAAVRWDRVRGGSPGEKG